MCHVFTKYNTILKTLKASFEEASAAIPTLVKLGHRLSHVDPEDMTTVQKHIESVVPNVDSRVAMECTVTMSSALVVCPLQKQESSYSVLMVLSPLQPK